jgi:hypothetical protein
MPPPLPPSASYLLSVVDSDDEEAKDLLESHHLSPERRIEEQRATAPSLADSAAENKKNEAENGPNGAKTTDGEEKKEDTPRKSKRKRNKRKKKVNKRVQFDNVEIRAFDRCLGTHVVPADGGWPLGISNQVVQQETLPLESFETHRQVRLEERLKELEGEQGCVAGLPAATSLETRQWDFKKGVKNPLFSALPEGNRMKLLLEHSEGETPVVPAAESSKTTTRRALRSRSSSFSETFNDTYSQVDVHSIRNELEQIRNRRTDRLGCSCRKLHVYVPPANAGKKGHHRRLKVAKVTDELRRRGLLPKETKSREELEQMLHDAVEKEPCCNDDCFCAQNGIQCQVDTCSCWEPSHHQIKTAALEDIDIETIVNRCGNRVGMYAVDWKKIKTVRQETLYCREVTTSARQ